MVYHWNDFFWPLVMTTTDAVRTLPVGVAMLREEGPARAGTSSWRAACSWWRRCSLVFAVAQRQIVRAFTFTSLK